MVRGLPYFRHNYQDTGRRNLIGVTHMARLRPMYQTVPQIIASRTVYAKVVYNFEYSEYETRWYVNGKLYEPATYFTSDLYDACCTANHMVAREQRYHS
jgi:hypothetical protein